MKKILFVIVILLTFSCKKDKGELPNPPAEDPKYNGLEIHPSFVKSRIKAEEQYIVDVRRFVLNGTTYYSFDFSTDGSCVLCHVYTSAYVLVTINQTDYNNNATDHYMIWENGAVVNQPI